MAADILAIIWNNLLTIIGSTLLFGIGFYVREKNDLDMLVNVLVIGLALLVATPFVSIFFLIVAVIWFYAVNQSRNRITWAKALTTYAMAIGGLNLLTIVGIPIFSYLANFIGIFAPR